MTFSGTAADDEGLKDVEVALRNSSTGENLGNDCTWGTQVSAGNCRVSPVNIGGSTYNWSWTTPFNLSPGSYTFTVRATDDEDLTTSSNNQGRLTINAHVRRRPAAERDDGVHGTDRRVADGQPRGHGHRRHRPGARARLACRTGTPAATCRPTAPWRPTIAYRNATLDPAGGPGTTVDRVVAAADHPADRRQLALHGDRVRH